MILKAFIVSFLVLTTSGNDDADNPDETADFSESDAFVFLEKADFVKDSLVRFNHFNLLTYVQVYKFLCRQRGQRSTRARQKEENNSVK